nr:hypothetical protein [uncultured Moellerella sp.]
MELMKIPYQHIREVLTTFNTSPELLKIADEYSSPSAFISQLQQLERYSDLVICLAHALPLRESIWWACCCGRLVADWNEKETSALQVAEMWVRQGDEKYRQLAGNAASESGLETGAGWVAQAAFWSGGSMLDSAQPAVIPPPFLYAQAVAGAVNLIAALADVEADNSLYIKAIDIALDIAKGGNGTAVIDQRGSQCSPLPE